MFRFLWFLVMFIGPCLSTSLISLFGRAPRLGDCYVKVRNNIKLRDHHVTKELSVNSLTECKDECDRAFFHCMALSYNANPWDRFGKNCLLSNRDTKGLNIFRSFDFDEDDDFTYYEKDNRLNCDRGLLRFSPSRRTNVDQCFQMRLRRERLGSQNYIRRSLRTVDKEDCEQRCLMERSFVCKGFYYKYRVNSGFILREDNCHLTSLEDALSGRTVFYDDDYDFYERMDHRGRCSNGILPFYGREDNNRDYFRHNDLAGCFKLERKGYRFDLLAVRQRLAARDINECIYGCQRALGFKCRSFAFRYSLTGSIYNGENCYLSDEDMRSRTARYDLVSDTSFDLYSRNDDGILGGCPRYREIDDYGNNDFLYRDGGYETVKGVRCLHQCRIDRYAGHYYCKVDHKGGWDFCCRPGSVCTYDYQVQYGRCEVGIRSMTQWRPCFTTGSFRRAFLQESKDNSTSSNQLTGANKTTKAKKEAIEVINLNDII